MNLLALGRLSASQATNEQNSLRLNVALGGLLFLCIVRLWVMPLPSSFWVDEMGSVFVVHHGASDPTLQAAPQVADSIYYALPALAEKLAGLSEVSYRIFSVLCMLGALLAIGMLGARLIDPRASWFVMFGCLASRGFNFQADDARPYALGTLCLSVALLAMVRWFDIGYWRDAVLFALCAATLWWVHLVFWPFYLLFVCYGAYRLYRRDAQASAIQIATAAGMVLLSCVPVAMRALTLLHGASTHVVVPPPSFGDLLTELRVGMITGACTLAALLGRYLRWPAVRSTVTGASLLLIFTWWLLDPLVLFVFSRVTRNSLFLSRYMYLALPGVTFTACLLTALFVPARLWKPVAAGLGCAILLFSGHWKWLWPPHANSDWRAAASHLQAWSSGAQIPVICPSPFIEAKPPVWTPAYPISGFLYSHLSVYPMTGHVYAFPFESSDEATSFARRLTTDTLASSPRFAIYGGDRAVKYWREWFAAQPELSKWDNKVLGMFGDVELVGFVDQGRNRPVAQVNSNHHSLP